MRHNIIAVSVALSAILIAGSARAQSDSETDRLREALRTTIAQTRTLEDQRTALQAKLTEAERERDKLKGDVKKLDSDYRQAVKDFNARLEERNETLDKWKDAYEEAATVARTKDAERAKFESESAAYKASTKACVAKNTQLVKVGRELLHKYEGINFGDAMVAQEPVLAYRRVEIQNLLQDYGDKILEQKVQP